MIRQAWCEIASKFVADEGLYGLPYGPNSLMTLRLVRILKPGTTWAGLEELV
ncbi:MAG: hypothetical protein L0Z46_00320 [Nitrospiraceae bacterium]|nr:hypothetical protein [Nitrospiraceae bacterium]